MVFSASYPHITTDDSLMETVSHGSPDYPFHFYYENMDMFDFTVLTGTGTPNLNLFL